MCDCAETFHRKCCPRPASDPAPEEPPPTHKKAALLALSALLCGLFGFLLYSLDRRTIKKILTMLGLGFLFAESVKSDRKPCLPKPNPCLKKPDPEPKATGVPKSCKCQDKTQACAPPPLLAACLPPAPQKKCHCCPNS